MVDNSHNMDEYSTEKAAQLVGVSAERIRQLTKGTDPIDHKRFGRTIVITALGVEQAKARNKKPGPRTDVAAGERRAA